MENQNELAKIENIFLALADKTRLRLLNLMRDGEVCVNLFSETLMLSQPKVSRHLAYLRNAGIVSARRQGKWIYYSIDSSMTSGGTRILNETFDWLALNNQMQIDFERLIRLSRGSEIETEVVYQPFYERNEEIETFLL
ncbi:MAG: metalloregulator ArsR/SmtB family transcription factor [Pyrinomonadaceae bacterium]